MKPNEIVFCAATGGAERTACARFLSWLGVWRPTPPEIVPNYVLRHSLPRGKPRYKYVSFERSSGPLPVGQSCHTIAIDPTLSFNSGATLMLMSASGWFLVNPGTAELFE